MDLSRCLFSYTKVGLTQRAYEGPSYEKPGLGAQAFSPCVSGTPSSRAHGPRAQGLGPQAMVERALELAGAQAQQALGPSASKQWGPKSCQ